jgi:hypothetical protein
VLNSALVEMVARDRIAEMRRAGVRPPVGTGPYLAADTTTSPSSRFPIRYARRAGLQHSIGWFLVSVGLRLALPRTRAGSGR